MIGTEGNRTQRVIVEFSNHHHQNLWEGDKSMKIQQREWQSKYLWYLKFYWKTKYWGNIHT